jgi:hypothetical protein
MLSKCTFLVRQTLKNKIVKRLENWILFWFFGTIIYNLNRNEINKKLLKAEIYYFVANYYIDEFDEFHILFQLKSNWNKNTNILVRLCWEMFWLILLNHWFLNLEIVFIANSFYYVRNCRWGKRVLKDMFAWSLCANIINLELIFSSHKIRTFNPPITENIDQFCEK